MRTNTGLHGNTFAKYIFKIAFHSVDRLADMKIQQRKTLAVIFSSFTLAKKSVTTRQLWQPFKFIIFFSRDLMSMLLLFNNFSPFFQFSNYRPLYQNNFLLIENFFSNYRPFYRFSLLKKKMKFSNYRSLYQYIFLIKKLKCSNCRPIYQ